MNIEYQEEYVKNYRGVELFTCRWLPLSSPKALVFLCHGYGMECSNFMKGVGTKLASDGFGVFGMDYEGHGRSMGPRCYIKRFDNIVNDISNHFKSISAQEEYRDKKRFLYGESMGGAVALLTHKKDPYFWHGAILVAPMCKINEKVKPHPLVVSMLTAIEDVIPKWKIVPTKDVIDSAFKDPIKREEIRCNKLIYQQKPRLKTALEMLRTSMNLEDSLNEVTLPFFVLHGEADIVTDPEVSQALYERAGSSDKTIKLYPGMWHGLTAGEPDNNIDAVFSDIISWLDTRAGDDDGPHTTNPTTQSTNHTHDALATFASPGTISHIACERILHPTYKLALIDMVAGYGMECSNFMKGVGTKLASDGFGVFGMDYEGHGRSMGARCYIKRFDNIVNDISNHFKSICAQEEYRDKKRFLYGESMGGAVALLTHKKDPYFWHGAILVAPMCKINEKVKPHPLVVSMLTAIEDVIPKWKIVPTKDVIDSAFKDPIKREEIRCNKLIYQQKPRLKTALEMLRTSMNLEDSLNEVTLPFFVLHGEADIVTDPEVSQALYERAGSSDKTIKLYPGMWHGLTAGEPDDNIDVVFSDIISWLDTRAGDDGPHATNPTKSTNHTHDVLTTFASPGTVNRHKRGRYLCCFKG